MTYIVDNASLSMYADDHQLYVKGYSVDCVEQRLSNGGHTISKWFKDNFLNSLGAGPPRDWDWGRMRACPHTPYSKMAVI